MKLSEIRKRFGRRPAGRLRVGRKGEDVTVDFDKSTSLETLLDSLERTAIAVPEGLKIERDGDSVTVTLDEKVSNLQLQKLIDSIRDQANREMCVEMVDEK